MGPLVRRVALAPVVFVVVATLMYATLRMLRPELHPGEPLVAGVLHDLDRVLLHLDLGCASQWPGCPRIHDMWLRGAAADVWLLAGAIVLGGGGGVLAGLWCAGRPHNPLARALEALGALAYCAPVYVVGLLLLFLFNPTFGTFPVPAFFDATPRWVSPFTDPWDWLRSLLVPWLVLGAPLGGMCLRLTVATLRDALAEDFVRTAAAKGVSRSRVLWRHAGPPSYAATVSFVGVSVPLLVTNMVPVERVLSVPGFFRYTWRAIGHFRFNEVALLDYTMLCALTLSATILIIVLGVLADAVLSRIDPRVRAAAF